MIYFNLFLFCLIFFLTFLCVFLGWSRLARVYHNNYSFFDILFILLYPFEEIVFLFLYYLKPELRDLWIASIIVLICCTVVVDKWLLKKQNENVVKVTKKLGENSLLEYQEVVPKLFKKIKFLDYEKKILIKHAEGLKRKIKRLKKKRS